MDWELTKINSELRHYDRLLYAVRDGRGVIQIWRQGKRIHDSMVPDNIHLSELPCPYPQYLFSITHNFDLNGTPVEMGLELLMHHVKKMDSWNRPRMIREMSEERENRDRMNKEQRSREFYDIAKDARRDIARVADQIF